MPVLDDMIPGGHSDKCGPRLKEKGKYERKGKEDKSIIDNIKYKEEKGGTSKSYTIRRLAIMPIVGRS